MFFLSFLFAFLTGHVEVEPVVKEKAAVVEPSRASRTRLTTGGDYARLRQCESGSDYRANTGNGYYGAYQFSLPTWRSLGATGLPHNASASEQDMRAKQLKNRSGWGQWPACSRKLGLE